MSPGSSESCSRILPRSTFETSTPGHSGWSEKVELPQTSRKTWVMRTKFLDDNRIFVVWVDVLFTLANVCICMYIMYIYIYSMYHSLERRAIGGCVLVLSNIFDGGHQVPIFATFLGLVCRFVCILVPRVENENSQGLSVKASTISGEVKKVLLLSPAKFPPPHFETHLLEVYRTWMGALPT